MSNKNKILLSLFILVSVILIIISIGNIQQISSVVTDDNIYRDLESKIFINSNLNAKKSLGLEDNKEVYEDVVIPKGAIFLSIDNKKFLDIDSLKNYIKSSSKLNHTLDLFLIKSKQNSLGKRYLFIVNKNEITEKAFIKLNSAVIISTILENGSSDRAGLKVGDIISKVNGKNFESALDAFKMTNKKSNRRSVLFTVYRNGKFTNINVQLKVIKLSFSFLLIYLIGLFLILLSIFIAIKRFNLLTGRILSITLLTLGSYISLLPNSTYTFNLSQLFLKIYFTEALFDIFLVLVFHSFVYFPFEKKKIVKKINLFRYYYIFLILHLIAFYATTIHFEKFSYIIYFQLSFLILTLIYFSTIFIKYKSSKKENNIYGRAIVWSYIINLIPVFYNSILVNYFGDEFTSIYFEYYYLTFLLIPFSYLYTIIKYDLLDSLIKFGKNIQYLLVISFVNLFSVSIFVGSVYVISNIDFSIPNLHFTGNTIEVLEKPLRPEMYLMYSKMLTIILTGLILYILIKLRSYILNVLNKKYHVVSFDYQKLIEELAESLQNQTSLENLGNFVLDKFQELLKLKQSGIIIFEKESIVVFQSYRGILDNQLNEYVYSKEKEIGKNIKKFSGNVLVDYLDNDIKEVFLSCKFKYVIPLRTKGKVLGLMFLGEKLSESNLKANDLLFATSLAKQAAISVENYLLYSDLTKQERIKQELEIAREIQLSSLPRELPSINNLDISGISIPALEVGGDYYDIFIDDDCPNIITAIIGDVSGKGTSAALYMSKIQGVVKTLQEFKLSLKDLMIKTNELIFSFLGSGSFITAFSIQFDLSKKTLKMARAGHLPLYYYSANQSTLTSYTPKGIALGLNTGELFNRNLEEKEIEFLPGDVIILVTDGIIEARNSEHKEYEEDRLKEVIKNNIEKSSQGIKDSIISDVNNFTGRTSQFDDITILVIKVLN